MFEIMSIIILINESIMEVGSSSTGWFLANPAIKLALLFAHISGEVYAISLTTETCLQQNWRSHSGNREHHVPVRLELTKRFSNNMSRQ